MSRSFSLISPNYCEENHLANQAIRPSGTRHYPIDVLRGLVIVVMALDHANYFVAQKHSAGEYWGGPFPSYDGWQPFLARLVTHIAAPGFFMLMGCSMVLFAQSRRANGWSRPRVIGHFWIRGLILVGLQLLVVNQAWALTPGGWNLNVYIGVLFALGGAMLLSSLFLWLNNHMLIIALTILLLSTGLFYPNPAQWDVFMARPVELIFILPGGDFSLWSNYPILPWLPAVFLGLVLGQWLINNPSATYKRSLVLGLVFIFLFFVLRYLAGFGNIRPSDNSSWIAFFNLVKYPPSLNFLLLTSGVNLILLWAIFSLSGNWQSYLKPLAIFGRTPLFFYIVHLFLYAALGKLLAPDGSSIAAMLPIWILGLVIMFPLCLIYARIKAMPVPRLVLRFI